jgi:hypothetical protein
VASEGLAAARRSASPPALATRVTSARAEHERQGRGAVRPGASEPGLDALPREVVRAVPVAAVRITPVASVTTGVAVTAVSSVAVVAVTLLDADVDVAEVLAEVLELPARRVFEEEEGVVHVSRLQGDPSRERRGDREGDPVRLRQSLDGPWPVNVKVCPSTSTTRVSFWARLLASP